MPYTVLIKHAIRIVHPTVLRRVVIQRTELLTVRCVKRVRVLHLLPAYEFTDSTFLATVTMEFNIHQTSSAQFIRHIVINSVNGQFYIDSLYHIIIVVQYRNSSDIFRFLYWQQQITRALRHFQHRVTVTQYNRFYLCNDHAGHHHSHQCQ